MLTKFDWVQIAFHSPCQLILDWSRLPVSTRLSVRHAPHPSHVRDVIRELRTQIKESSEKAHRGHEEFRKESRQELQNTKKELQDTKGELRNIRQQLEALSTATASNQSSPRASFAEVARTPPTSQPTNLRTLSMQTTPSSLRDTFYCTIDTTRVEEVNKNIVQVGQIRQAIESEMRAKEGHDAWRCAAVVKESRNAEHVKIICRDEAELQRVKEAAQKTAVVGVRVMRDQLYPVKVGNANRTAVLDGEGNILLGAAEALGVENNCTIAKISWLSNRETGKAYGSMVVYVTKGSDAKRLLDAHYFDLAGESAITNVFEPHTGPIQCFNCQETGHKAYSCKKPQLCGRRADVVLTGDFNRHDLLWGGDEVSARRQGEGEPIVDLMNEHGLCSLLPRGTKTWQGQDRGSTIDLMLTTPELADEKVACDIHPTEHGSDHRAIQTTFGVEMPDRNVTQRLLFKNAPWILIGARVEDKSGRSLGRSIAQPPPYAKRWWTKDLTRLRRTYTYWRNQARAQRRAGLARPDLERRAKDAAKEYHDAIRGQRKAHWEDFVAEDVNIWSAAKYLQPGKDIMDDKVPPLKKGDGSTTGGRAEQAEELLGTFFPPLPASIDTEGERPQRAAVPMPDLTLEEIEEKVMAPKPWKAPGDDGLPAMVWKRLWYVVKFRVWTLFDSSLRDGVVPHQWRTAKIIPLKKPDKGDYALAKAWRPISLLSTLGKILEAVVAERISYAVEAHGLLPANHFGARKRRSADQALMLLQEQVYKAWRTGKLLSLISFDVKGAYNGSDDLDGLVLLRENGLGGGEWAHVRATRIAPGGPAAGIAVVTMAFLFFNAHLVQRRVNAKGGSIAFVDDYSAWVIGPTAEANRAGIESITDDALDWERRSGATFEADKTTVIHFTLVAERNSDTPFMIKGQEVKPKSSAKVLVIMDTKLRYKEHMARAAAKGLTAAMCLRRLKMLSPRMARQLFVATVPPTMDYASNVWMHSCGVREAAWIDKAQKVGAQAVTGAFRTVATAVAEAAAGVRLRTLPKAHPLAALKVKAGKRFVSPMQKIALALSDRIQVVGEPDQVEMGKPNDVEGIVIATSSSLRNGAVGMGGVVRDTTLNSAGEVLASHSVTLGFRDEQNPCTAELAAIVMALKCMPAGLHRRDLTIITSNRSALQVIRRPRQQSGQCTVRQIYDRIEHLRSRRCGVTFLWVPASDEDFELDPMAKAAAQRATRHECVAEKAPYQARSTTLRLALAQERQLGQIPQRVGKYSKRIDKALPGKHTRMLYDSLKRKEANVLAQLRTGMTRLNSYLHKIGVVESDACGCGQAAESVEHFLFRCKKWTTQREVMVQYSRTNMGNLSFFLGGKTASDDDKWKLDMQAVSATVRFAMATKRLDVDQRAETD
ncbi:reverse transcriptase [Drechmeria coniospora]|uniref:Reverse transcriptase n=1 Tax=Drechmeria coniospora TaxID=98403 RepID=A0A151GP49_DRECN|nr:reverse transcriptase [Drechmeria coniospora]KYK58873.1 reverse transcriptase [Drechmeria coniospora]